MSPHPTEGMRSGRSNGRARRGRRMTAGLAAGAALALAVGITAPAAATPPESKTVAPAAAPNAQQHVAGKKIIQEIRGNRVTVPAFGFAASSARCPAGQQAAAGGWVLGSNQFIVPVMSFAFSQAAQHDSWQVQFHNPGGEDYFFAQAIAFCSANT
ncbi:hypothetical protein [Streptomyces sp. NPDC048057]|uniref:hypothetical protein n=1 Tax=Streptomyces sp. NPDC048057 TaxID=3155628 RepID=UPI0033EC097A